MNPIQRPNKKVTLGALAGSVTAIALWALNTYAGAEVPAEIGIAISTVITFALQYFVSERSRGQS